MGALLVGAPRLAEIPVGRTHQGCLGMSAVSPTWWESHTGDSRRALLRTHATRKHTHAQQARHRAFARKHASTCSHACRRAPLLKMFRKPSSNNHETLVKQIKTIHGNPNVNGNLKYLVKHRPILDASNFLAMSTLDKNENPTPQFLKILNKPKRTRERNITGNLKHLVTITLISMLPYSLQCRALLSDQQLKN